MDQVHVNRRKVLVERQSIRSVAKRRAAQIRGEPPKCRFVILYTSERK